jgi:hypothetical protein
MNGIQEMAAADKKAGKGSKIKVVIYDRNGGKDGIYPKPKRGKESEEKKSP